MRSRRIILAAIALALAVVAGIASYSYLNAVQRRAYHNAQLVPVYTLSAPVAVGTPGATVLSRGLIKRAQIPRQYLPADAVTDLATIRGDIAVANLVTGQILEQGLFEAPSAAISSAAEAVPAGDVAITVSVDAIHGVAGLIHPGDEVDILVQDPVGVEQFLYQDVRVLAVGTELAPVSNVAATSASSATTVAPATSGLITFAVPPRAAARIALAQSDGAGVTGPLYLALVPPGSTPTKQPAINQASLIPASVSPG